MVRVRWCGEVGVWTGGWVVWWLGGLVLTFLYPSSLVLICLFLPELVSTSLDLTCIVYTSFFFLLPFQMFKVTMAQFYQEGDAYEGKLKKSMTDLTSKDVDSLIEVKTIFPCTFHV